MLSFAARLDIGATKRLERLELDALSAAAILNPGSTQVVQNGLLEAGLGVRRDTLGSEAVRVFKVQ